MKRIMRYGYYLLAVLFSKVILWLPFSWAIPIGGWLGSVAFYLVSGSRKLTIKNLRACFPEKDDGEILRIAREVYINQGKNLFELFSFPKISTDALSRLVTLKNKEALAKAFSKGKGVFIAGAHCGNWEVLGAAIAQNGFPMKVIAKHIYIEGLNKMLVALRGSQGIKVILRSERDSAREILRSLRGNIAIGMLIDQDTSVPGVFVNFFSRPAWTPSGLATLALKTGATVIIAVDIRLPGDTHEAVITGPLDLIKTGDYDRDVLENTQMITAHLEKHIRQYPSQWVWMHDRWKTKSSAH